MANLIQLISQLSQNPQQLLQRYGIPQNLNTPQSVADYLINNGKVTQQQINQANQMYRQFFNK